MGALPCLKEAICSLKRVEAMTGSAQTIIRRAERMGLDLTDDEVNVLVTSEEAYKDAADGVLNRLVARQD